MLFKQVKNTVGKGEIARYEQFLLFQRCFQKACFPGASKGVIVWERVKLQSCVLRLTILKQGVFENVMETGENAVTKHLTSSENCSRSTYSEKNLFI